MPVPRRLHNICLNLILSASILVSVEQGLRPQPALADHPHGVVKFAQALFCPSTFSTALSNSFTEVPCPVPKLIAVVFPPFAR